MPRLFTKDPQAVKARGFNWDSQRFLTNLSPSETITASTWTVTSEESPVLLTLSSPTIVTGNKMTKVTLTGGTVGMRYIVTNHVTTSGGTQDDRSFAVLIEQE